MNFRGSMKPLPKVRRTIIIEYVSADRYSQAVVNPMLRNRTPIRAYENGLP